MPLFATSGNYMPEDYSFDDYTRYLYLKGIAGTSSSSISSVKHGSLENVRQQQRAVVSKYEDRLSSLRSMSRLGEPRFESFVTAFIREVNAILSSSVRNVDELSHLIGVYSADKYIDSEFDQNVIQTLENLKEMVAFMQQSDSHEYSDSNRDPEELAPKTKSLQNLREAWMLLVPQGTFVYPDESLREDLLVSSFSAAAESHSISCDILEAHIKNIKLVKSADYEERCRDAVLSNLGSVARGSSGNLRPNPGFLLSIYTHTGFKSGWLQLLLLAILVTAALVAAAFMVNPAVLPLAVSGLVTGLSKVAANLFFGTAVTVAAAATVTLAASLRARFFAKPDDNGGGAGGHAMNSLPNSMTLS